MREEDIVKLLKESYAEALKSPDPSTQNGAVLIDNANRVIVKDHNRFPDGVKYLPERWERPGKYKYIEHAERNVVFAAARLGIPTDGLTMVCGWAACSDCARAIVQSGISRLVTHKQAYDRSPAFWLDEIKHAYDILKEGNVELVMYDGQVDAEPILHSGQLWKP